MIYVTSLAMLDTAVEILKPTHMVTLLGPENDVGTPPSIKPECHLKLVINDIIDDLPGLIAPHDRHIDRLLDFVRRWGGPKNGAILFHCYMGISRSGAAAYIALCDYNEPGREVPIAREMRRRGPHISPNIRMVQIADDIMEREGRMVDAVAGLGAGTGLNEMDWLELPIEL